MTRRTRLVVLAVVLALGGAVAGSLVALSGGSDGAPRPSGAQTVLRVEPADDEVSCGGGPAVVRIYLDDLARRPSPRDANVAYGIGGFQLALLYDPAIVRIERGIDVELNAALSEEDSDGDGLARSFFPVSNIDDGAGVALLGGASVVVAGGGANNLEEGPDAVAKGESLLLMTVRFLPVGKGTTELLLSDPDDRVGGPVETGVVDPGGGRYEPLTLREATVAVRGGDCPAGPFATPRPTPGPLATPALEPTLEIVTPVALTPTPAAEAGRPDCPRDWAAYNDPDGHFSICYPLNWKARVGAPQAYFGSTLTLRWAPEPVADRPSGILLTVYWESTSPLERGVTRDLCTSVSYWRDLQKVSIPVGGAMVEGCIGDATDYSHPGSLGPAAVRGTFSEISVSPGAGFVVLFLSEAGSVSQMGVDPLKTILGSLRISE